MRPAQELETDPRMADLVRVAHGELLTHDPIEAANADQLLRALHGIGLQRLPEPCTPTAAALLLTGLETQMPFETLFAWHEGEGHTYAARCVRWWGVIARGLAGPAPGRWLPIALAPDEAAAPDES